MQLIRTNVTVNGQRVDVHARIRTVTDRAHLRATMPLTVQRTLGVEPIQVAFCGVYIRPVPSVVDPAQPLVPGYWTFPEGAEAVALLTSVGVTL